MADWVRVAAITDLTDGDLASFEVDGAYVAVARVGGDYYAFADTCTHRACSLSEGELDGTTVICPCHAGEFDVRTGEVLDGPPPEGVASYPARAVGDSIEIAL